MLNICVNCGLYRPDKIIDPAGPYAICPECGHRHLFRPLPLLIVSGASGAGKSTVCHQLLGKVTDAVLLDSDILWRPEFESFGAPAPNFFETWLRVAKSVGQSGRPVVGVDPVSWTPHGWGGKERPRCRGAIGRTRRSSGSGSSSWSAKDERLRSWRASSSRPPSRSGTG